MKLSLTNILDYYVLPSCLLLMLYEFTFGLLLQFVFTLIVTYIIMIVIICDDHNYTNSNNQVDLK